MIRMTNKCFFFINSNFKLNKQFVAHTYEGILACLFTKGLYILANELLTANSHPRIGAVLPKTGAALPEFEIATPPKTGAAPLKREAALSCRNLFNQ